VFRDPKKGNCESCHPIGEKSALFTDNKFHNIGVGYVNSETNDKGRYVVTKNVQETGAFRTPTLRNVELTAPYMHDGSLKDIKQVMDFYIGAGNSNPYLDHEIHSLDFLTRQERDDLQEFMKALNGTVPPNVGPPEVADKWRRRVGLAPVLAKEARDGLRRFVQPSARTCVDPAVPRPRAARL
jgi:cytochrome c peroxidase